MEKENIKLVYSKLLIQWETERVSKKLNALNQKDFEVFLKLEKEIHLIENEDLSMNINENISSIIMELKHNSSKMIDYFINDLLDMRQEKIVESCRNLEIIEEELLTASEIKFYRNIMSAFKGYRKMRNIYQVIADACETSFEEEETNNFCATDEFQNAKENKKEEYVLIRVINEVPAIVSVNGIIFGPFQKEEMAVIPKLNALILEKEKLVELFA
ncbi:MAG: hypothetical protein GY870_01245 [archaeon]|nr:hypothetical protein [archaeon]